MTKGYVKIYVNEEENGVSMAASVKLTGVTIVDKIALLNTFVDAIDLDDSELIAAAFTLRKFRETFAGQTIHVDTGAMRAAGFSVDDDDEEDEEDDSKEEE